jgi:propionate CoA-transferase
MIFMKVVNVKEAVAAIKNSSSVVSTGFVGSAVPEYIFASIEEEFLANGAPNNLTVIWNAALGNGKGGGVDHLGHKGLITKAIAAHCNLVPKIQSLIDKEEIPAHILPLGSMSQLYREIGAGKPGLISKVGLGTFVDPRISGGKANKITTEDIVEVINIHDQEFLFYKAFPMDVAIIRGTTIDDRGNLSCENEVCICDMMVVAQAVKRNGGVVIAQVENVCSYGSINPRDIIVPGFMIDYAVVAPKESHPMTFGHPVFDPAWSQQFRVHLGSLATLPLDERKIIARRAALELAPNQIVNLGFGMPEGIASVAAEEGINDKLTLTVECGHIGGVPAAGLDFGACYNSDYVVDMTRQMDWYEGGALDVAFLGAAEIDSHGNANVTKFGKTVGPGGFINIAHTAKKVCYCGTLTAGGLKTAVEAGKLVIRNEGKVKKYVPDVEQISFSGATAIREGQEVLYITERAVFKLTTNGPMLVEIAPGVDLQTQVLDQIAFAVKVSPDIRPMDKRIFADAPMGIAI